MQCVLVEKVSFTFPVTVLINVFFFFFFLSFEMSILFNSSELTLYLRWQEATHDGREDVVPVAVLFSGGLDSMILAAILHECLDARCR